MFIVEEWFYHGTRRRTWPFFPSVILHHLLFFLAPLYFSSFCSFSLWLLILKFFIFLWHFFLLLPLWYMCVLWLEINSMPYSSGSTGKRTILRQSNEIFFFYRAQMINQSFANYMNSCEKAIANSLLVWRGRRKKKCSLKLAQRLSINRKSSKYSLECNEIFSKKFFFFFSTYHFKSDLKIILHGMIKPIMWLNLKYKHYRQRCMVFLAFRRRWTESSNRM